MTDKQRQRVHDITYSTQDRMELAERIVGLEDEAERLREQVTQLQDDWESERDYADQMEAKEKQAIGENAKLRELVEAILQCAGEIKRDKGCDACPMYNGEEAGSFGNHRWCLLRTTLRELGIEV